MRDRNEKYRLGKETTEIHIILKVHNIAEVSMYSKKLETCRHRIGFRIRAGQALFSSPPRLFPATLLSNRYQGVRRSEGEAHH
jgi:hypothetical protein